MPKYYGGSQEAMVEILEAIRRSGCSFLVAGRLVDGEYRDGRAVAPPPGYEGARFAEEILGSIRGLLRRTPAAVLRYCGGAVNVCCDRTGLFRELPGFRVDISSTDIRRSMSGGSMSR